MAKSQPKVEQPKSSTDVLVVRMDNKVQAWTSRVNEALDVANKIVIQNDEDLAKAGEVRKNIKSLNKEIETETKTILSPLTELLNLLKGKIKPITATGEEAEKIFNRKASEYMTQKQAAIDKLRREDEAKRTAEAERLAADHRKKLADAIVNGTEAPPEPVQQEAPPPIVLPKATEKVVSQSGATIGGREQWKFEIIDAKLIPANYMIPNEKLIGANVRAGVREIPGVRIYSVIVTTS
jgi:hypothetical protein